MKRTNWRVIATLIAVLALLTAGAVAQATQSNQSLGDYARKVRQNKPAASSESRHYDNDNLPTNDQVSVVGPAPTSSGNSTPAQAAASPAPDKGQAQSQRDEANRELQKKIKEQQDKVDALTHELDLDQREYRLRAAVFYSDAGNRLRNSAQWDKDDGQYKSDIDTKEKAVEAAKQQLQDLQEQARKAGLKEEEKTVSDKDQNKDKDDKDKGKD